MELKLKLTQENLCTELQTVEFEKLAILVGENGSGKSCILQNFFEQKLGKMDIGSKLKDKRVVCFSTGPNENFSELFSEYLEERRNLQLDLNLDCLYCDKSWAKLMICLAFAFRPDGEVRKFFSESKYFDNMDDMANQIKLEFAFKVDEAYAEEVTDELETRSEGKPVELIKKPFHIALSNLLGKIKPEYGFEGPLEVEKFEMSAIEISRISYLSPTQLTAEEENDSVDESISSTSKSEIDSAISFFLQAADRGFIDISSVKLTIGDNLELKYLSDGEYHLLYNYALIDLFDSDRTLFLIDEADTHVHHVNNEKVWSKFHNLKGEIITTSHNVDSITAAGNRIENIEIVIGGRISEESRHETVNEFSRNLTRATSFKFDMYGREKYLVLIDDYVDWKIFVKLVNKLKLDRDGLLSKCVPVKVPSGTERFEILGNTKIAWVEDFLKYCSRIQTKIIFLICDKDTADDIKWNLENMVEVSKKEGRVFFKNVNNKINNIKAKSRGKFDLTPHLLIWRRRDMLHYLISYTSMQVHKKIKLFKDKISDSQNFQKGKPCDNDEIRNLSPEFVKEFFKDLIFDEQGNLDESKLDAFVEAIDENEVSEDIKFMFNFLKNEMSKNNAEHI